MILWIPITIFIILSILLFIMDIVQSKGEENVTLETEIPKDINVILVLSAGVENNGELCDILIDRLNKAITLSEKIKNSKILLSGNPGKNNEDEVIMMKRYIMAQNKLLKDEDILLDKAATSTYVSIYRAKEIFKISKVIIVTNYYHLPRALYIAKKLGIYAVGVFSDSREYMNIERYRERELLAQVKDFMYINISRLKRNLRRDEYSVNLYNRGNEVNKVRNTKGLK